MIRASVQVYEKLPALNAPHNLFGLRELLRPHEEVYVSVRTQGRFRIHARHAPTLDEDGRNARTVQKLEDLLYLAFVYGGLKRVETIDLLEFCGWRSGCVGRAAKFPESQRAAT
jgi:hypothetical protein